jgi:hypothetical protein
MKKILFLSSLIVCLLLVMVFLLPNYHQEAQNEMKIETEKYKQAKAEFNDLAVRIKEQEKKDREAFSSKNTNEAITQNIRSQNQKSQAVKTEPKPESYAHMLARIELGKPNPDDFTIQIWESLLQSLSKKTGDSENEIFSNLTSLHLLWNQKINSRSIFSIACDIDESIKSISTTSTFDLCAVYLASGLVAKEISSGK